MPSPFNNQSDTGHTAAPPPDEEEVTGSLYCDACFGVSTKAKYVREAKLLYWACEECNAAQMVRNIEL